MKSGEINSLFKNLSKVIKNPRSDLKYKNKFTLLVSVVLSAQCTDVNVNNVTKNIYPKYNKPEPLLKLVRLLESFCERKAKINKKRMQLGDVRHTYANIKESRKDLKFKPRTNLEDGLEKFVSWYKEYHNIY